MPRATATEIAERVEHLQGMILAGQSNTVCLTFARQTWGISRSQGYRLLKKAWAQIKDDINESGIDRQELLSWSIQTLITYKISLLIPNFVVVGNVDDPRAIQLHQLDAGINNQADVVDVTS